jgi:3-deoxy-D-manno-octulosonic-acid transferase
MFFIYSLLYTLGFITMLPVFAVSALSGGKYAAGFRERLGTLPEFTQDHRAVIWLHCVSVGETNAARPLVNKLKTDLADHRLVISTVTRTGYELAGTVFADAVDCVFYVPFDWAWSVRKALKHFNPSILLLVETEIWPNLLRETRRSGAHVAIVNGRLSEKSFSRYLKFKKAVARVLGCVDLALMQNEADAMRLKDLGMDIERVKITGNLKFDHDSGDAETSLTDELRERYNVTSDAPLIIAASTHSPEEKWILEAFGEVRRSSLPASPRLMLAPRHPERFDEVADIIKKCGCSLTRRSDAPSAEDKTAEVILLDSIGELRAAYPLAEIVFVGGSLIPHGGQSIFEPAAAGKAIVTGPYTANFDAAVTEFRKRSALVQLPLIENGEIASKIASILLELLTDDEKRQELGENALAVMNSNSGAVDITMQYLKPLLAADTITRKDLPEKSWFHVKKS